MDSNKKIMILDDEPDIQDYLMAALEDAGYDTCTIDDINNISDSISKKQPDLLVLDIMMPDRSGLSIYKEIQMKPELKKIPVIIISGLSTKKEFLSQLIKGQEESTEMISPLEFIEKPVQLEHLEEKIESLLT